MGVSNFGWNAGRRRSPFSSQGPIARLESTLWADGEHWPNEFSLLGTVPLLRFLPRPSRSGRGYMEGWCPVPKAGLRPPTRLSTHFGCPHKIFGST